MAVILTLTVLNGGAFAQSRNALVIGNGAYTGVPALKTPATDAAIVAETLRAADYDVTELHDVKQATIGQSLRDFLDKVAASGSAGIAFVYFSGYGAQWDGETYLIPVDAPIKTDADIGNEAFRLRDLTDELTATPQAARIVVLDAARELPLVAATPGKPVRKGLAIAHAAPGMLLAYSAAPGAIAKDGPADYSLYTGALVTALRQPGLDIEQILKNARLAVTAASGGKQTPWSISALTGDLRLFDAPDQSATDPAAAEPEAPPPKQAAPTRKRQKQAIDPSVGGKAAIGIMREIIRQAPF